MISIFTVVISSLLISSCSKEDDNTTTLTVYVKCRYSKEYSPYKRDTAFIYGANIYLYKDLNFALDIVNGTTYDYLGNGKLKNKVTGVEIAYWEKELSASSFTFFKNIPNGTYGVVVDISNWDKEKKLDDNWEGISIRLPENLKGYKYNNALNFVFNIWPYQPLDIEDPDWEKRILDSILTN